MLLIPVTYMRNLLLPRIQSRIPLSDNPVDIAHDDIAESHTD